MQEVLQQKMVVSIDIWGFPYIGMPQNRWFIMENPTING
jgi:hypothetical protein